MLPPGPKGETGATGATGAQGPQGNGIALIESAYDAQGNTIVTIQLQDGTRTSFTVNRGQAGQTTLYKHAVRCNILNSQTLYGMTIISKSNVVPTTLSELKALINDSVKCAYGSADPILRVETDSGTGHLLVYRCSGESNGYAYVVKSELTGIDADTVTAY